MLLGPMMAYDPATASAVLFGGATNDISIPESPDTWTWKEGTWTRHVTAVHPHAGDQTVAFEYDPAMGKVLLVEGNCDLVGTAGCDTDQAAGQTWSWDGTNWTQLNPLSNPPRAIGVGFAYAGPATNRMVLFGIEADTWQWDGSNWSQVPTSGTTPCPRILEAMAYGPNIGGIVLFGGVGGSTSNPACRPGNAGDDWNDTWIFTPFSTTPPAANPMPSITDLSPSSGAAAGQGFTLVVNGAQFVDGSFVLWNGSARPTTFVSHTQLTAAIPASDLTISGDLATASVTVSSPTPGGGTSAPLPFTIASTKVLVARSATAPPAGTASVSILPETAGQAGLAATLTNGAADPAMVTVATYAGNPTGVHIFDTGGSFVDLRVSGAVSADTVGALFYYPSTTTGAAETALQLLYFDGARWAPVLSSGGLPPPKDTTDDLANTISGGRFSVTFDRTSTPSVTALGGTVFGALVVDTTPPVITPTLSGTPNAAGWFNRDVTISWSVSDPESGIASSSGCGPSTLSADTVGTTVTCSATNGAGLSGSQSVTVKIDKTPPATTAVASPVPDQTGLNTTDVTVTLSAADNPGGSGVDGIHFQLAGAQAGSGMVNGSSTSVSITAEGSTTVTYFATDRAGNQEAAKSLTVRITKTAAAPPVSGVPPVSGLAPTGGTGLSIPVGLVLLSVGLFLSRRHRSAFRKRAKHRG
jgi:hypothetical protein